MKIPLSIDQNLIFYTNADYTPKYTDQKTWIHGLNHIFYGLDHITADRHFYGYVKGISHLAGLYSKSDRQDAHTSLAARLISP